MGDPSVMNALGWLFSATNHRQPPPVADFFAENVLILARGVPVPAFDANSGRRTCERGTPGLAVCLHAVRAKGVAPRHCVGPLGTRIADGRGPRTNRAVS